MTNSVQGSAIAKAAGEAASGSATSMTSGHITTADAPVVRTRASSDTASPLLAAAPIVCHRSARSTAIVAIATTRIARGAHRHTV
jgi:hypothetical protein